MTWRKFFGALLAGSAFLLAVSSNIVSIAPTAMAESADSVKRSSFRKCAVPSLKQAYAAANSVFVGKVSKMTQEGNGKTFEFKVEKYWKGSKKKTAKVTVYETTRYQAYYQLDKKYLVFARMNDDGDLTDGRCSRSKDFSGAADDIKGLGKARVPR